jgi:alkylation response protein AidB-like acyl-CoA dehydrogenase
MGLRGTGSYDYEIPERFVEAGATWNITMGYASHQSGGGIFVLGPLPLKEQPGFQRNSGVHKTAIEAARIQLLSIYNDTVALIESGASDAVCGDAVRRTKAHANYIVRSVTKEAVRFAWETSGSAGMRNPSRLQRCFRDIHIGAGHTGLR